MKIKKVLSLLLATVMATSCFSGAFAEEEKKSGDIPLTLEVDAPVFSVTVPTELPAHFDAAGKMVMPDNIRIENHSTLPVRVTNVMYEANTKTGWYQMLWGKPVDPTDEDIADLSDNGYYLSVNSIDYADDREPIVQSFNVIPANESESFTYRAYIKPRTTPVSEMEIGTLTFTFDWAI